MCSDDTASWEKVTRSVVDECAPDWYRLGIELMGFKDSHIRAMTSDIPTPQCKLQAIIERKSMEHGKENTVEALLDACDKIMPLTTIAVMKNLRIKYIDTELFVGFLLLLLLLLLDLHRTQCQ